MNGQGTEAKSFSSRAKLVWLNAWFWTVAPLVTLVSILIGVPCVLLLFAFTWSDRWTLRLIRRSISYYSAIIMRCGWPLVLVKFVDLSPGDQPPFVVVANHPATSDAFLMGLLKFESVQVLKEWAAKIPVIGFIAKIAGYIRVREISYDEFIRLGLKCLEENIIVIVFPEGTRSGSTEMGQFHGAAFRLAQQAGVKIVPLAIAGNENIPCRGSAVIHPGKIVVTKLPAITPKQYEGMSPYKLKMTTRDTIQKYLDEHPN